MRCMLLVSFALSFFLAILPHHASAVHEITRDSTRQMLQWVAETARQNYGQHLTDMKRHSEHLAGLRKELATAKRNQRNERGTKHVEGLNYSIEKYAQMFNKLSNAAGQNFRTNRQLYATLGKIKPAEETKAHKALKLVGKNAAQLTIKYANLSKEHLREAIRHRKMSEVNFGISARPSDLNRAELGNPANPAGLKRLKSLTEQEIRHWELWHQADKTLQRAVMTKKKVERTIKGTRP